MAQRLGYQLGSTSKAGAGGAVGGGAVGLALSDILIYLFPGLEQIEQPIQYLLTLALGGLAAALAAKYTPSSSSQILEEMTSAARDVEYTPIAAPPVGEDPDVGTTATTDTSTPNAVTIADEYDAAEPDRAVLTEPVEPEEEEQAGQGSTTQESAAVSQAFARLQEAMKRPL